MTFSSLKAAKLLWLTGDEVWSQPESGYALQVEYPGGQTGILNFTYDGTKLDSDYNEGDRDGDDGAGNTPPAIVQPPPTPDPSPTPEPLPTPPSDPTPPMPPASSPAPAPSVGCDTPDGTGETAPVKMEEDP